MLDFLRGIPKIQVHCHLEGTLTASSFAAAASEMGRSRPSVLQLRNGRLEYVLGTFAEFSAAFSSICHFLSTPAHYAWLASQYVEDALAQNVVYAELFVAPSLWHAIHPGLDVLKSVENILSVFAKAKARGMQCRLILGNARSLGAKAAFKTIELALHFRNRGVLGIGLGGRENANPDAMFASSFQAARSAGLHVVAHAGEIARPENVWSAINLLGAERIGHGIAAAQDNQLVHALKDRRIPLEICPTSNYRTGAVPVGSKHPFVSLRERGVRVLIDTDDPGIFDCSITSEYTHVARLVGLRSLISMIGDAIDCSFAGNVVKRKLRDKLAAYQALDFADLAW